MILTGEIKEVTNTSYTKGDTIIRQKNILVEYTFYRFVTAILFTAPDSLHIPDDIQQIYNFEFDIRTKFVNDKLFTDFILNDISTVSKIGETNYFVVVNTNFDKEKIEILKTEEIKGRIKYTVALIPKDKDARKIYAYYWEDNPYLSEIDQTDKLQLNCKSLPYKERWINNVEVWRTVANDNFLGSII